MKKMILSAAVIALAMTAAPFEQTARAEDSYQVAQAGFDTFIDANGRRVIVDPYTGQVVRIIEGNRRFNRTREQRRWRQQQREIRRERRRARLERKLDKLFSDRSQTDLGFDNQYGGNDGKFRDTIVQRPLPEPETQIARLPDNDQVVTPETVRPEPAEKRPSLSRDSIVKLQIFLDREGFSPGVIDGAWGSNLAKAVTAWQEAKGNGINLTNPLVLDKYVNKPDFKAFSNYQITREDVNQSYVANIPVDYSEKAQLKRMSYTSPAEMLAERFHMSEAYLRRLNPGADFNTVGQSIRVAAPGNPTHRKVHYIVADKSKEQLRAYDRNGNLVNAYPATIGSAQTPSPSGKVEVARIALNPNYTYNPKKNFQQGSNDKILTIAPGPNGPVGSVWIALSKPTYGIHGTPNPDRIGKTNSNGCIRLTNWDAKELASLISKGVTVEFLE